MRVLKNTTLEDIILRTGTESRRQWQELRFNRSACVPVLIGQEKLASSGPAIHLCLGREQSACISPCLNAALHLSSPLPSLPLVLRHLLKLGLGEAKTGVTFNFHSFPCSGALISSAHLSPNDSTKCISQSVRRKTMGWHLLLDVFFRRSVIHSAIKRSPWSFGAHCIVKLEDDQARAGKGWKGELRGQPLQSVEKTPLLARGTSVTPKVR